MRLKSILVCIDDSQACKARIQTGLQLAKQREATLIGLYVINAPVFPVFAAAYPDNEISGPLIEAQIKSAGDRAARAQAIFESLTQDTGVNVEWMCEEGDFIHHLSLKARYVDLILIGQADPEDVTVFDSNQLERAVLEPGRPVLVTPKEAVPSIGRHVMLAWNGKREAMRAASDALGFFEQAERVTVCIANPPDSEEDTAASDIERYFKYHEIDISLETLAEKHKESSPILLDYADTHDVDLIVMGAYGHSRFREMMLGSMTRHMLSHSHTSIFLTH